MEKRPMKIGRGLLAKSGVMAVTITAAVALAPAARAQDIVETETTGPNRALLRSGIAVFAMAYVPSFAVAATNSRTDDDYLYIPVAGPWLDLGNRLPCINCNNESLYKALLVTDGVFQGIGALEIVGSIIFMQTTVRSTAQIDPARFQKSLHLPVAISPAMVSSGYGLVARGQF
jgi:hypothetical protein